MQLPIPKEMTVSLDSMGQHIRFSSRDMDTLFALASNYSRRKGLRSTGVITTTTCTLTPEAANQDHNLGVPSAHFIFLVSHSDREFAGSREPETTTIYRTLTFDEGAVDSAQHHWVYHFSAELK